MGGEGTSCKDTIWPQSKKDTVFRSRKSNVLGYIHKENIMSWKMPHLTSLHQIQMLKYCIILHEIVQILHKCFQIKCDKTMSNEIIQI